VFGMQFSDNKTPPKNRPLPLNPNRKNDKSGLIANDQHPLNGSGLFSSPLLTDKIKIKFL
jgi:hypothetical protein